MKKLILPILGLAVIGFMSFSMLSSQIQFSKVEHDFGDIPQGEPVTCEFEFTNTGDADLILLTVKASCGCTTPEWPKEPIAPGKTGVIKAVYNAAGLGTFNKSVTVTTNAGSEKTTLRLKGNVTSMLNDDDGAIEFNKKSN